MKHKGQKEKENIISTVIIHIDKVSIDTSSYISLSHDIAEKKNIRPPCLPGILCTGLRMKPSVKSKKKTIKMQHIQGRALCLNLKNISGSVFLYV